MIVGLSKGVGVGVTTKVDDKEVGAKVTSTGVKVIFTLFTFGIGDNVGVGGVNLFLGGVSKT